MKKIKPIHVASICICACLFIFILIRLDIKVMDIGDQENVLLYKDDRREYGFSNSAKRDVLTQLESIYGQEDTEIVVYMGEWQGRDVEITEKVIYSDMKYLGKQFDVGYYAEGSVDIVRNAYDLDSQECISTGTKVIKYIGFDVLRISKRAEVLEDTLTEEYIGDKELFEVPVE
ncbi:MAG: hypothetical protein E7191_01320 [Erysipelotrichaceae bacterium]|nr:hypothetical protein [Erysipelotrichaceae bacterium]